MNAAWIMLTVAGLLEVGWAVGLKYTDGFNFRGRPLACSMTLVAMIASMYLLSLAVRSIPIGTGYAIWTGIGALGAATLGMILFREPVTAARIGCVLLIVAGIVGLKLTSSVAEAAPANLRQDNLLTFYVGSNEGVSRATFDLETGKLGDVVPVAASKGASFIALHPKLPMLYAVAETSKGSLRAFRIGDDGALTIVNEVSSAGGGPCHVSVAADGAMAFVANYGSGSIAALPVNADGALGDAVFTDQHTGRSINEKRQSSPRAHCCVPDPSGRFVLSADLGTDELVAYQVDPAAVTRVGATKVTAGSGPRIVTFSSDGKFVYVVTELMNTIETFGRDATTGRLTMVDSTTTLPEDFKDESFAAELVLHPNGRFLYASNRGHDSIAMFAVDPGSGRVAAMGHVSTGGKGPRHFAIEPGGRFMVVANTKSDTLVSFAIDPASGSLAATGSAVQVKSPACVTFRLRQ
jgi:6-phosphogluconolactonase